MPSKEEENADLPPEIIIDILSRLPIHSLFQFTLVSKTWCDIILRDPFFAALHHTRAIENHTNNTSLIFCPGNKWSVIWPNICNNSFPTNLPLLERVTNGEWNSTATAINTYFDCYDGYKQMFKLVGSCNGLLCLYLCARFGRNRVYVCNPLTGEYTTLPRPTTTTALIDGSQGMGFGYDFARNEYKVVRLLCQSRPPYTWEAEIYTLGTASWRSIGNFPGQLCSSFPFSDVLVNGALHWMAEESGFCRLKDFSPIVSLDLCDEQFRAVPVPSFSSPWISFDTQLMSWNGYLSIVEQTSAEHYSASGSCVWIMKEYNVKESWTKMYNIRWPTWLTAYHGRCWPFDDESVRELQVPESHRFEVLGHVGSLISLKTLFRGTKMITKKWKQMGEEFCNSSYI